MLREIFGQAIFGDGPEALQAIEMPGVNLAVWENPLSAEAKEYLKTLPLEEICRPFPAENGYFYILGKSNIFRGYADRDLDVKNLLSVLPESEQKPALVRDIVRIGDEFMTVANRKRASAGLLVFKPGTSTDEGGFWHTDAGYHLGNITLAGEKGMIWRPDHSLPAGRSRQEGRWGNVLPAAEADIIQQLPAQDFAIFKCRPYPNPLVHATPEGSMVRGYRLVLSLEG